MRTGGNRREVRGWEGKEGREEGRGRKRKERGGEKRVKEKKMRE